MGPLTGVDITNAMACSSYASSGSGDPCTGGYPGRHGENACSSSDFSTFNAEYMENIDNNYLPLLESIQTLSQPLDMQREIEAIIAGNAPWTTSAPTPASPLPTPAPTAAPTAACNDWCNKGDFAAPCMQYVCPYFEKLPVDSVP